MDHGPYLDHRAWTMVHGPCTIAETMVYEPLNMGHGSWFMEHGPWTMIHGPWAMVMVHGHGRRQYIIVLTIITLSHHHLHGHVRNRYLQGYVRNPQHQHLSRQVYFHFYCPCHA